MIDLEHKKGSNNNNNNSNSNSNNNNNNNIDNNNKQQRTSNINIPIIKNNKYIGLPLSGCICKVPQASNHAPSVLPIAPVPPRCEKHRSACVPAVGHPDDNNNNNTNNNNNHNHNHDNNHHNNNHNNNNNNNINNNININNNNNNTNRMLQLIFLVKPRRSSRFLSEISESSKKWRGESFL